MSLPDPPAASSLARRVMLRLVWGGVYAAGMLLLLALTFVALRVSPVKALQALELGAIGGGQTGHLDPISETLVEATPLLLTGLGVVVAWQAGLFSIGGEGQLLVGALAAATLGRVFASAPPVLATVLMLMGGVGAGAAWGLAAGWLRVRRNVQEVISTIMLNYAALYLVSWAVAGPLEDPNNRLHSRALPDAVLLARVLPRAWTNGSPTRLHVGDVLAWTMIPIIALLLYRTVVGFGLRTLGQNAEAARVARFPIDRLRLQAMAISGGLCGLAGVIELLGASGSLSREFSPGWGFTAIPVALLGGLHPVGAAFSALFFGALTAGSARMERTVGVPSVLINVVQAAAVLAVVGVRAWQARRTSEGGH